MKSSNTHQYSVDPSDLPRSNNVWQEAVRNKIRDMESGLIIVIAPRNAGKTHFLESLAKNCNASKSTLRHLEAEDPDVESVVDTSNRIVGVDEAGMCSAPRKIYDLVQKNKDTLFVLMSVPGVPPIEQLCHKADEVFRVDTS